MKKRILSIMAVLSLVASLCCTGCGNNSANTNKPEEPVEEDKQVEEPVEEDTEEVVDTEQIKSDLDAVYSDVCKMDEECQYMSSCILMNWDVNGGWIFEGLFDRSYGANAKQEWKEMRDEVFAEREDVKNLQTSIPDKLKSIEVTENLKEYKDAISEMFIEVNSFATIVTEYPSGYTKLTYSNLMSEYKTNVEKAKSAVELKR